MSQHLPHYILVYGYDLEKGEVDIVDHNYANSYEYMQKSISMENLLLASRMFKEENPKRRYACCKLKKRGNFKDFSIWEKITNKNLLRSYQNSLKNLEELKRLFVSDIYEIEKKSDRLIEYLTKLKSLYFTISQTKFFKETKQREDTIGALTGAYSNVLSLFWKMKAQRNYEYGQRKQDRVLRKIEEIERLEEEIYKILTEVCG